MNYEKCDQIVEQILQWMPAVVTLIAIGFILYEVLK